MSVSHRINFTPNAAVIQAPSNMAPVSLTDRYVDRKAIFYLSYRYSPPRRTAIKDYKSILLSDGKITLRPSLMSDAEPLYQAIFESIAEIRPWLTFAHEGYSIRETKDFLRERPTGWKKDTEYAFNIIDSGDGSITGGCGFSGIDKENGRANLGYWVRTSRTGEGIATSATLLLAKWGFMVVKLNRIEILASTGNKASQRVAEKAGAQREGVMRNRLKIGDDLHDAVMYSLIPRDIMKTGYRQGE